MGEGFIGVEILQFQTVGAGGQTALDAQRLGALDGGLLEQVALEGLGDRLLLRIGHDDHPGLEPSGTVVRQHDRDLAIGELDEATHRKYADRLHELLHERPVEGGVGPLIETHQRILRSHRLRIGTVGDQRREAVGNTGDPAPQRDLGALEAARVAAAIEALVMLGDAGAHLGCERQAGLERLESQPDMVLRDPVLDRGQHAGLVEQRARHARLADIGKQADQPECFDHLARQAEAAADGDHVERDPHPVLVGCHVRLAHLRHPQHRIRVVDHAGDHVVDCSARSLQRDLALLLDIGQQGIEGAGALREGLPGPRQFLGDRTAVAIADPARPRRQDPFELAIELGLRCAQRTAVAASHVLVADVGGVGIVGELALAGTQHLAGGCLNLADQACVDMRRQFRRRTAGPTALRQIDARALG